MPPPSVVNERLCSVDSAPKEGGWPHPCVCKLYAVLRRDHHSESRVSPLNFNAVGTACELQRVVGRLRGQLVFFRVVSQLESRSPYWLHNVFLNVLRVPHSRDLLDHSTQEQVADV